MKLWRQRRLQKSYSRADSDKTENVKQGLEDGLKPWRREILQGFRSFFNETCKLNSTGMFGLIMFE